MKIRRYDEPLLEIIRGLDKMSHRKLMIEWGAYNEEWWSLGRPIHETTDMRGGFGSCEHVYIWANTHPAITLKNWEMV